MGCFASGAVAVAGHGLDVTLGVFTGVTLLSLPIAHWVRRKLSNREAEEVTRDDVGHSVTIISAEAGKIRASYRGTVWDARLEERQKTSPRRDVSYFGARGQCTRARTPRDTCWQVRRLK